MAKLGDAADLTISSLLDLNSEHPFHKNNLDHHGNTHKTEDLLNLCRDGELRQNEQVGIAVSELSSYIVFASLLEFETELPEELESRVEFLRDVRANPDKYPQDIFLEDEDFVEVYEDGQDPPPPPPRAA